MARIKFIPINDLVSPNQQERQPSPRQLATMKRESEYEKAVAKLTGGKVAVFEPSDEKVATLRASLARVIARNEHAGELHFAMKRGIGYVALEPIPGARSGRKKKA